MAERRKQPLPALGQLELAALQHLWRVSEGDVAEVHAAVAAQRGVSVNTVGSALERLHRKKLVSRRKVSHAYRYTPDLSPDDFAARQLAESLGTLRSLANRGLVVSFLDLVAEADQATLDQLEEFIARKRGERKP
jgi:predicted transcriptional regulator